MVTVSTVVSNYLYIFGVIFLLQMAVPTLLLSFLQLFLCRKELKWGRILPIYSAVVSVICGVLAGVVAAVYVPRLTGASQWWMTLAAVLVVLVIRNIPTLVYSLIYRAEQKRQSQMDLNRMKIDDLE